MIFRGDKGTDRLNKMMETWELAAYVLDHRIHFGLAQRINSTTFRIKDFLRFQVRRNSAVQQLAARRYGAFL